MHSADKGVFLTAQFLEDIHVATSIATYINGHFRGKCGLASSHLFFASIWLEKHIRLRKI